MKQKAATSVFPVKTLQFLRVSRGFTKPWLGRLICGTVVIPCSLGRNGATHFKREGDGKTPIGAFRILSGFIQRERFRAAPATQLALQQLTGSEGWCDDVNSPTYNRPIRLPNPAGHEILKRSDEVYDLILVLDYNIHPRIKGRGSAIFFHLTRRRGEPTAGCIAIGKEDMRRLLPRLGKKTRLLIV
jgi:L,D-peptidoglycan transpeptidase YkuD (ErfK/YbiS/YcfS/YnhG family)